MAIEIGTLVVRGSFGTAKAAAARRDAESEARLRRMLEDMRRRIRDETEEMIETAERRRREG